MGSQIRTWHGDGVGVDSCFGLRASPESSSKLPLPPIREYRLGTVTCFVGTPSVVGLKAIWPSRTACSRFLAASSSSSPSAAFSVSRCRMFFFTSSRGPGLFCSWLLSVSASFALLSCGGGRDDVFTG